MHFRGLFCCVFGMIFFQLIILADSSITGYVDLCHEQSFEVKISSSASDLLELEKSYAFEVGIGDRGSQYLGRESEAKAVFYNDKWNLEKIFPIGELLPRRIGMPIQSFTKE